jgi:hypothetical protein
METEIRTGTEPNCRCPESSYWELGPSSERSSLVPRVVGRVTPGVGSGPGRKRPGAGHSGHELGVLRAAYVALTGGARPRRVADGSPRP